MILGAEPLTEPVAALTTAILIEGCTAVDIVGNNMRAVSVGVHGDNSGAVRVCDNTNIVDGRIYGIDVAAPYSVVRDNTVNLADPTHGGIRGTGTHIHIEGNSLLSDTSDLAQEGRSLGRPGRPPIGGLQSSRPQCDPR